MTMIDWEFGAAKFTPSASRALWTLSSPKSGRAAREEIVVYRVGQLILRLSPYV